MGAWDTSSFGNDTANGWMEDLEEHKDLSYIDITLQTVLDAGENSIKGRDAERAVAAAEVVARLFGKSTLVDTYTETIARWAEAHPIKPTPALIAKAAAVVDRIGRPPSDLLELWEHCAAEWAESLADLRNRLMV